MQKNQPKVGSFMSWGWIILMVFLVSVVQLPLLKLNHGTILDRGMWAVIYLLGFAVTIAIGGWEYHRLHPKWQRLSGQDWGLMIKGYAFMIFAEIVLGLLNKLLYHETSTQNNQTITTLMDRGTLTMVLLAVTAVCASPIIEELTFRGLLIDGCFSAKSFWLPIVISGIIFSIPHASNNPVSWIIYAVMGGTFAYVYKRTGKLQSTILMHAFNNLIAVAIMLTTLGH